MTILHLDSSPLGDASVSRQLTAAIVAQLTAAKPGVPVVYRDLAVNAPDHLTAELLQVVKFRDLVDLNERQTQELALTDALVDEFLAADTVVIGAPMFNFSVPTQLKAWIDRIAQAGRTFTYTATGPVGLAGGKTVIIASTRGGVYTTSEGALAMDHQESYLQTVFGFLGITDITVIRAEGVNMGPEIRDNAIDQAKARIASAVN